MDSAYFEDLAGRLYGLVIRLANRLPADQAKWLHHVTDIGEYGLALEDMAGMLAHGKIAITDQERSDMLALADRMKMDGFVPGALESCPQVKWRDTGQGISAPRPLPGNGRGAAWS
jgi:hypothetical protein